MEEITETLFKDINKNNVSKYEGAEYIGTKSNPFLVLLSSIVYKDDWSDEDEETSDLPEELKISLDELDIEDDEDDDAIEDSINDYLLYEYGFTNSGLSWKRVGKKIAVFDIDWDSEEMDDDDWSDELKELEMQSIHVHPDCRKISSRAFEHTDLRELIFDNPVMLERGSLYDTPELRKIIFNGKLEDANFLDNLYQNSRGVGEVTIICSNGEIHPEHPINIFYSDGEWSGPYMVNPVEIIVPDGVTEIEDNQFANETGHGDWTLKHVYIPDSVIRIGEEAFYDCIMLQDVELGIGIKEIGERAFDCYHDYGMVESPTINYKGTLADWAKVKNDGFKYCGDITVVCTDGKKKYRGSC